MKTRHGFVSNSSSSSFVVAFPHKPESVEEVKKILFGNRKVLASYGDGITTEEAASTVFKDIKRQRGNSKKRIVAAMAGWLDGQPDLNDKKYDTGKKYDWGGEIHDWEKYSKDCKEYERLKAEEFIAEHPDEKIYTFSYADEDGSYYSTLEHGGTFNALPHVRISRH